MKTSQLHSCLKDSTLAAPSADAPSPTAAWLLLPRSLHRWHTLEMSSLDHHIVNGTQLTPFPTFLFNYSPWYSSPSTWHIYLLVLFPTLECKFTQERHSSIYLCMRSTRTLPGTLQELGKYCCTNELIKIKWLDLIAH